MSIRQSSHLEFWGKASPHRDAAGPPTHPVAYHLLDIAATVDAILTARPLALGRAASLLGLSPEGARTVLVAMAGLHDLGKFAPFFQAKVPEHLPEVLRGLSSAQILAGTHTEDGYVLWCAKLRRRVADRLWPDAEDALDALAPAIFGHHGSPAGERRANVLERFRDAGLTPALACADAIIDLLCPAPLHAEPTADEQIRIASWWVAGLMTVADWIGSGQRWFPYTAPLPDDPTLSAYWAIAKTRAANAVREAGILAPMTAPLRPFAQLVGSLWEPSPTQRWAENVALPDGPCLVVVEDVTGAGKTEAAQMIVHRLMTLGRAAGAYWAMPTQATANAMYGRQTKSLDLLYADGADPRPSLVLAHGQQRLHRGFRNTVLDHVAELADAARTEDDESSEADVPGTATCAAFLADDRRAALLADVGAGTVDQALLGVLPSRFNSVRLFGLADRVLVVDEAHAYDAYMGVEIQELLRFQAALGGCAIVLSATLPQQQRANLVEAWRDGIKAGKPFTEEDPVDHQLTSSHYPLATVVAAAGLREEPLEAAPWSQRDVAVRLVHELDDALSYVAHAAANGAAVAWIRNTVDECLAAAATLRERGVEKVMLFHARFAQCDRQEREVEVLTKFGKDSTPADREGWVLLATQVVEQSLDLDFDAMVSDVAPIDLLIQRAGRLWRHADRERAWKAGGVGELVVLAPPPNDNPPKDWLGGVFAGSAAVYQDAGVLWRTVQVLAGEGRIRTPGRLRHLIEGVYGSDAVPDALMSTAQRAGGKEAANAATARYATLKVSRGYCAGQDAYLNELRVPTRLGDQQTTVRLARVLVGERLAPFAAEERPAWRAWALSEIKLNAGRVPQGSVTTAGFTAAVNAARAEWGRFEQELPILPLREAEPGAWRGELIRPDGRCVAVHYSTEYGLAFDGD